MKNIGHTTKPKRKRLKKTTRRILSSVVAVLCTLLIISGLVFWKTIQNIYKQSVMAKEGEQLFGEPDPLPIDENGEIDASKLDVSKLNGSDKLKEIKQFDPDVLNILLLGLDGMSYNTGVHTDTMIMMSVNTKLKTVKLVSFMRDTYICMDDWKNGGIKLTSAYTSGGPERTINYINHFYDLDIQKYVAVNFKTFMEIVDSLGGLDVEIKKEEFPYINRLKSKTPGIYHLDGNQVLEYARIRSTSGDDFQRTARQRHVIELIMQDFLKEDIATQASAVVNCSQYIKTNIPPAELASLGKKMLKVGFSGDGTEEMHLPNGEFMDTGNYSVNGVKTSLVISDFMGQKPSLHQFVWGTSKYIHSKNAIAKLPKKLDG